jgi:hypothetical protein
MHVGSYLDPHDLQLCTTQLCSSGAGFVATGSTNKRTTTLLHELVACCRLSVGVEDVAQGCIERIESFLARRGKVQTIILDAPLKGEYAANASVYSDIHDRLQQGSWFQLDQNQEVIVEWNVSAESIAQVEFLLCADAPKDGARASDSSAGGALRQYLHTLDLSETEVCDVSVLASFTSLHTLDLENTQVSDVSALASCQSLHTLNIYRTKVSDVSPLASFKSLHTLDLSVTNVRDVSALASCQSLHTLQLGGTQVFDVSALASCKSLHTLNLWCTQVIDVSALALCQSLRQLWGVEGKVGGTEVLQIIKNRG